MNHKQIVDTYLWPLNACPSFNWMVLLVRIFYPIEMNIYKIGKLFDTLYTIE